MHVEAEAAAIDLRCADFYQVYDRFLDAALPDRSRKISELFKEFRRLCRIVQSLAISLGPRRLSVF
jgi:hypothetical protein